MIHGKGDDFVLLDPRDVSPEEEPRPMPFRYRGFPARFFLAPGEEESDYNLLLAELAIEFPPVDLATSVLVERLGQQIWLLRRYVQREATFYAEYGGEFAFQKYLSQSLANRERAEASSLRTIRELQRMSKARVRRPRAKKVLPPKPAQTGLSENMVRIEGPRIWI